MICYFIGPADFHVGLIHSYGSSPTGFVVLSQGNRTRHVGSTQSEILIFAFAHGFKDSGVILLKCVPSG